MSAAAEDTVVVSVRTPLMPVPASDVEPSPDSAISFAHPVVARASSATAQMAVYLVFIAPLLLCVEAS